MNNYPNKQSKRNGSAAFNFKSTVTTVIALLLVAVIVGCDYFDIEPINGMIESIFDYADGRYTDNGSGADISREELPAYSGSPYVMVNGGKPYFEEDELTSESYEYYSNLDSLGRCGYCIASVSVDIMPTEKRGDISSVKPTGWHSVKYDCVDGGSLYNRCHLIGYQLSAENANKKNLITGTRYMNTEGMLPFENMVADYVKETENHVLYRVTPIFTGDNLVADGVLMEAYSVEDDGEGICFCVYCYNVQPGIEIDYATGDSKKA